MNEASIMKENITEVKSVMVSPNKEIAAVLDFVNNPREQISQLGFWFFWNSKIIFHLSIITSGNMCEGTLYTCILFWHVN